MSSIALCEHITAFFPMVEKPYKDTNSFLALMNKKGLKHDEYLRNIWLKRVRKQPIVLAIMYLMGHNVEIKKEYTLEKS